MSGPGILPNTVTDALFKSHVMKKPTDIKVRRNGKYTEIVEFRFVSDLSPGSTGLSVHSATGSDA